MVPKASLLFCFSCLIGFQLERFFFLQAEMLSCMASFAFPFVSHKHLYQGREQQVYTGIPYLCRQQTAAVVITLRYCFFVGCLTSQQQGSVSQGWICSDNFTCCHTKIEVTDQTLYLTQSQYTDTGPTSPSGDPIMPGAWRGGR